MRHKWDKQPNEKLHGVEYFVWTCKSCGCKKSLGSYKFSEADYDRNGQHYSHYIECIDYDLENSKTID